MATTKEEAKAYLEAEDKGAPLQKLVEEAVNLALRVQPIGPEKQKEFLAFYFLASMSASGLKEEKYLKDEKFGGDTARILAIRQLFPENRAIKHFDFEYFDTLEDKDKEALMYIAKSGICNPDSGMGCYAINPTDYDKFKPFFQKVLADYHKTAADPKHVTDWKLEGVEGLPEDGKLDLEKLGLPELSMRVRVGRNLGTSRCRAA